MPRGPVLGHSHSPVPRLGPQPLQQRVDKLRKKPAIIFIRRIVPVKSIARMLRFDRQPVGRIQKSGVASAATPVKVAVYACKKPCREPAAHDAAVMPPTVGVKALDLHPCQKRNLGHSCFHSRTDRSAAECKKRPLNLLVGEPGSLNLDAFTGFSK